MRKALTRLGIALAALLVALFAAGYAMFGATPPIPDGERLGDRVTVVKDGYVSAAIVDVGGGRVALVDAGNDGSAAAIRAALERAGRAPADVTDILVTHGHPDHVAGIPSFPGTTVHALGAEVPVIEGRAGTRGPLPRWMPASPTGIAVNDPVADGARIRVGELDAEVFAMPGHTDGSGAWLIAGVLFFGDAADATRDGQIVAAKWIFSDDTAVAAASIRALADRLADRRADVRALHFAHSGTLPNADALFTFD